MFNLKSKRKNSSYLFWGSGTFTPSILTSTTHFNPKQIIHTICLVNLNPIFLICSYSIPRTNNNVTAQPDLKLVL